MGQTPCMSTDAPTNKQNGVGKLRRERRAGMVTTTGTGTSFGGSSGRALHAGCSWLGSPACNASIIYRMHNPQRRAACLQLCRDDKVQESNCLLTNLLET